MVIIFVIILLLPLTSYGQEQVDTATDGGGESKRFDIELELDAYYSSLGFFIALTDEPIPHMGERKESEIYKALLSKSLIPRFLVIEASVNPMPCLGVYMRENAHEFYNNAQVTSSFNWVKALTAGFEEPYAASFFVGNVIDYDIPGRKDITGKGYGGYLVSFGNYHIKDNGLIPDNWSEFEWKIKGDRKSPIKKMGWSFRIGAKIHENPDITDIFYLSFRRSRLDYKSAEHSIFSNSGFEYTFDMDRHTFNSIRHYFFVDKKMPLENRKIAFTLVLGFVWESAKKYSGVLSTGREKDDLQVILRPNIEF